LSRAPSGVEPHAKHHDLAAMAQNKKRRSFGGIGALLYLRQRAMRWRFG